MSLERQLADLRGRAAALAEACDGDRRERAEAVLAALKALRVYCGDPAIARAVAISLATVEELNEIDVRPSGRPPDPEIAASVWQHGVRGTARRLQLSPATVCRRLKCFNETAALANTARIVES